MMFSPTPSPASTPAPVPTGADFAWAVGLMIILIVSFFVLEIIRGTTFNYKEPEPPAAGEQEPPP